jgi:MFS family permease
MKAIILIGIIGVIAATISLFTPWGTITIEYPERYYGPRLPEIQIFGSLLAHLHIPLMLGLAFVMFSMMSSAISPERQHLVGIVFLLTGGLVMLIPFLYGIQVFIWGHDMMQTYLAFAQGQPYQPVIQIEWGWGVSLYVIGAILPIIASCIWFTLSYALVEKED